MVECGKFREDVPVGRGNSVTRFASLDTREFEGSMKESAAMKQVDPTTKRHKLMACGVRFRGIGRLNEMCCCGRGWCGDVANGVILQPISLVGCIEPNIGVMEGIEFHEESPILQA